MISPRQLKRIVLPRRGAARIRTGEWRFCRPLLDHRKGKTVNNLRIVTADLAALTQRAEPFDPDLDEVIDAWPDLPEAIKAAIVGMVKGVVGDKNKRRRGRA